MNTIAPPDILNTIGLGIFLDTGMAKSKEEAEYLRSWADQHKRWGVTTHEAVFHFFQMVAWRNPEIGVRYLKIKPALIRRRLRKPRLEATEAEFRMAVMGHND